MRSHPSPGRSLIAVILVASFAGAPTGTSARALTGAPLTAASRPVPARSPAVPHLEVASVPFRSLPLRFELNRGQTDPRVRFLSSTQTGDVFLTPNEMVLRVRAHDGPVATKGTRSTTRSAVVRLRTLDANPNARIVGLDPLPGVTNYFIGNDPAKWHTDVPSFARVKYENVYPGIDLIYYGNQGHLEYDFDVAPGADPDRIALSVEGTDGLDIDDSGDLVLHTAVGNIHQHAPHIYQWSGADRVEVAGGYVIPQPGRVAFAMAGYDASKPLVIDPEVVYATYFGGTAETDIHAIAVDANGSVYVAGDTFAHDFPTVNPEQSSNRHDQSLSATVTKFSPDGASLIYSTYLGGSGGAIDAVLGIAVDSTGAAYVTGTTNSADFPTKNPIPLTPGGFGDIFVAKLSADGSGLVYSSVLGGSDYDEPKGIALDATNTAYVYGKTRSTNFPTVNPTQPVAGGGGFTDGFWLVVSPAGTHLLFSTYVGGNNDDDIRSFRVTPHSANVYLGGVTQSTDFAGNDGSIRGFVAHFEPKPAGAGVIGPAGEIPAGELISEQFLEDAIRLPGQVSSALDSDDPFMALPWDPCAIFWFSLPCLNRIPQSPSGNPGAEQLAADIVGYFSAGCVIPPGSSSCTGRSSIVVMDPHDLTVKSAIDVPDGVPAVIAATEDFDGAIYVTGNAGRTAVIPLVNPVQGASGGSDDAFVTAIAAPNPQIFFSTFLGGSGHDVPNGIAVDPQGNIYVAGQTTSPNFPTKNAYQATPPAPNGVMIGQGNSFIAKIALHAAPASRDPVKLPEHRPTAHSVPPRGGG